MNRLLVVIVVGVVFFSSCKEDYRTHESGLEYNVIIENKDNKQIEKNDVVTLTYVVFNMAGEVVDKSGVFRTYVNAPSHSGGAVEDALCLLHKGDSAVFLIDAGSYFGYTRGVALPENVVEGEKIKFSVKILDVITEEEHKQETEAKNFDRQQYEEEAIAEYIKINEIEEEPSLSGLYIILNETTNGERPQPGQLVTLHYTGSFLNGERFDSSFERNEPFSFVLGKGNIIQGWEEGVAKMRLGERATLIIPSHLAYGEERIGPIPPFSTLVFEVVLVDIE